METPVTERLYLIPVSTADVGFWAARIGYVRYPLYAKDAYIEQVGGSCMWAIFTRDIYVFEEWAKSLLQETGIGPVGKPEASRLLCEIGYALNRLGANSTTT